MKFISCKSCIYLLTGGSIGGGSAYGATTAAKNHTISNLRSEINDLESDADNQDTKLKSLTRQFNETSGKERSAQTELLTAKGKLIISDSRDRTNEQNINLFLSRQRKTANCEWSYRHNYWENYTLQIQVGSKQMNIPIEMWGCRKDGSV